MFTSIDGLFWKHEPNQTHTNQTLLGRTVMTNIRHVKYPAAAFTGSQQAAGREIRRFPETARRTAFKNSSP